MLVGREDLYQLLGLNSLVDIAAGEPGGFELILEDGHRRATLTLNGANIQADLVELSGDDASTIVITLSGEYDEKADSFALSGEDASGQSSDPTDPRGVASAWRRMTYGMQAAERPN
jgi:hypothetical protein